MEMYQVIRYFLNEMEKKIWHALLTLVLFVFIFPFLMCLLQLKIHSSADYFSRKLL